MDVLEDADPAEAPRRHEGGREGAVSTRGAEIAVRLDSLDPVRDRRSLRFREPAGTIAAHEPEEVVPALRALEAAVARGLHAAGFLAYEAGAALDPHFASLGPRPGLPLLWFGLFREREEAAGDPAFRAEPPPSGPAPRHELAQPPGGGPTPQGFELGPLRPSVAGDSFRKAVERIRDYIASGDSYQVNHTFRLRAAFRGSEAALYRRLCEAQRAAYCAHLRLARFSVLSASPELFFRWSGRELELRPMKGTRPRGRWSEEDEALAAELVASEKERAENLMIVDLMRNDAGRVAEPGSVRVSDLFRAERYPTVHQLTSTVRARTRPDTRLVDVLRALFPSGSVTGAPKLRTSEIIAELEDSPRGVYTGAIGCVSPRAPDAPGELGEAVFSVAIRTLLLDREAGEVELGVGAGITWDSDPAAELRECLDKAAFVEGIRRGGRGEHGTDLDFELLASLRHEAGAGYLLLDAHLDRLAASARYFDFPFETGDARARLLDLARGLEPGVHKVRLIARRSGELELGSEPIPDEGIRDAAPRHATPREKEGLETEAPHTDFSGTGRPLRVGVAPEPVDARDPFLYHKTTRRGLYRSRRASRPECDDALLVNGDGELTESTRANLVLELDGELLTPPVEAGLLPGVFRAHLLERGEIRVRRLVPEDLRRAEAVFLINAVRGWRRALLVP